MSEKTIDVWVADDDASIRFVLERAFRQAGMRVSGFESGDALLAALRRAAPDVIVTDIRMPGTDGLGLLERLGSERPDLPVIVITAYADLDSAVAAYRGGAFEYLPKPFDVDEAIELVRRAVRSRKAAAPAHATGAELPAMIGKATAMQEVFRAIGRLARSSMTVLITGESGTGKELVARALHDNSPRAAQPFIALNVSAIPGELLESELFGHERGAFTGADARRYGRFEQADGGTLFLDEIGDMPMALQTRLLRVLAEGDFYRVGGHEALQVDVRVIAATHRDLAAAAAAGSFREDLYHRLNVMHIDVPPLRNRREDIALLLERYLAVAADELGTAPKTLSDRAAQALTAFDWPGNIRQLINACRRLTALAPGTEIRAADIPAEFGGDQPAAETGGWETELERWADRRLAAGDRSLLDEALPAFEKVMIASALRAAAGKRQKAAELLGWGRNTLTRKIREHGLD